MHEPQFANQIDEDEMMYMKDYRGYLDYLRREYINGTEEPEEFVKWKI